MDRRQIEIDYWERIRKQQKEAGVYNPNLNNDLSPAQLDRADTRHVIRPDTKRVEAIDKYKLDPTLI